MPLADNELKLFNAAWAPQLPPPWLIDSNGDVAQTTGLLHAWA